MNYAVSWKPAAEDELVTLWNAGPDRDAITKAADRAEDWFARNPTAVGESRVGPKRLLFIGPLLIDYEVREADRTVLVLRVRRSKRTR